MFSKELLPLVIAFQIFEVSAESSAQIKLLSGFVTIRPVVLDIIPLFFLVLTISESEALELTVAFPGLYHQKKKKQNKIIPYDHTF